MQRKGSLYLWWVHPHAFLVKKKAALLRYICSFKCYILVEYNYNIIHITYMRVTHCLILSKSNVMFVLFTLFTPLTVICTIKIYNQIFEMVKKISHLIGEDVFFTIVASCNVSRLHSCVYDAYTIYKYLTWIFRLEFFHPSVSAMCVYLCLTQHKHPHGFTLGFACFINIIFILNSSTTIIANMMYF